MGDVGRRCALALQWCATAPQWDVPAADPKVAGALHLVGDNESKQVSAGLYRLWVFQEAAMFRRLLLGCVLGLGLAGCYYYSGGYDVAYPAPYYYPGYSPYSYYRGPRFYGGYRYFYWGGHAPRYYGGGYCHGHH